MDLESRVLQDFYPRYCEESEGLRIRQGHGVKSRGFRNIGRSFEFTIESPSVKDYRQRKYLLNYHRNGANSSEKIKPENFAGLIGESIMRIVIKEFFRRLSRKYCLKDCDFIKTDLTPFEDRRIIKENEHYRLFGISRYNQIVMHKTELEMVCETEYDGLFEYSAGRTQGLVICESKVGTLGYLKANEENKKEIYKKIIKPIQSLFPERQVDFLLMGTREELQKQKKKYKPLKGGLEKLNEYLNEHNIGLIPFFMPVSRKKIDEIATSILYLNKISDLEENRIPKENKHLINDDIIRIITGKRIDMILKRTGQNTYSVIYSAM